MTIDEMKDEIIRETISEVNIDPTDRLNSISDEQIKKEYLFINLMKGWD